MNEIVCFQCSKIIKKNSMTYNYCDATLCSLECSNYRKGLIDYYDPNFMSPEHWRHIKNYHDLNQLRLYLTDNKGSPPLLVPKLYCIIDISQKKKYK